MMPDIDKQQYFKIKKLRAIVQAIKNSKDYSIIKE